MARSTWGCLERPRSAGKTAAGALSPEKPALTEPEPRSSSTVGASSGDAMPPPLEVSKTDLKKIAFHSIPPQGMPAIITDSFEKWPCKRNVSKGSREMKEEMVQSFV